MARPEKSEVEKLTRTLAFRLTEDDFAHYQKKIAAAGSSKSEFFREHVLRNTTQVVAKQKGPSDAFRAIFLLQKASNNINQLAHRANSEHLAGTLSEDGLWAITDQLKQLNQFLISQTDGVKNDS